MNFCSDNVTGITPEIMAALLEENSGAAMLYGNDELTAQVEQHFAAVFECDVTVALVSVGANALALAQMVPPHGAIYCHADAHIHCDECGAPEFYYLLFRLALQAAQWAVASRDRDCARKFRSHWREATEPY